MFLNIFKKNKAPQKSLQHIAFPVSEFDALPAEGKRRNHDLVTLDGWEFTARAYGWIVMSRESALEVPGNIEKLYGVKGARQFSDSELNSLHRRLSHAIQRPKGPRAPLSLEKEKAYLETFDAFAEDHGLNQEQQKKILHLMRFQATRGQIVGYEDLGRYPFSTFGDLKTIFGQKLDNVLSLQNKVAREAE